MTSKSTKEPWSVDAVEFGRSLTGFGINLLVSDMARSLAFAREILLAEVVYWNEDFAVLEQNGVRWMLHADHTYSDNAYLGVTQAADGVAGRGAGVELQLYNMDPDAAEQRARTIDGDHHLLAGCLDKPHGLRECYILDPDGYCWVISRPSDD